MSDIFSSLFYRLSDQPGSGSRSYYSHDKGKTWSNDPGFPHASHISGATRDGTLNFRNDRLVILEDATPVLIDYGFAEDAIGFEFIVIGGEATNRVYRNNLPDVLQDLDAHGWEVVSVTEGMVGYTVIGRRYAT